MRLIPHEFSAESAFDELKAEIDANQALNDERWTVFLNSNPVKHVKHAKWADEEQEWNTYPLVNIGGLWGTICFDNIDENFQDLICRKIGRHGVVPFNTNATSHAEVQAEFGTLPVLLTNVKCIEDSTSFQNCTSGPMGFDHCESGTDLKMACGHHSVVCSTKNELYSQNCSHFKKLLIKFMPRKSHLLYLFLLNRPFRCYFFN